MNKMKKGTEKILSIYWFAILAIVTVGIVAMVSVFYNHPYDVREIEAEILADKVADCLSYGGRLNTDLFDSEGNFSETFKNNFLKNCNLNFNVENVKEWKDTLQYYIEINFYKFENLNEVVFNFSKGNEDLKADCGIQKNKKEDYETLPKCVKKRFYSLGNDNTQYLIEILSVVRKTEKNVK